MNPASSEQPQSKMDICRIPSREEIRKILGDNVPIAVVVILNIIAVYSVHAIFGIKDRITIVFYFKTFAQLAIALSGLFLIPLVLKKSHRSFFTLRHLCGFLTIFLLTPVFISTFSSFKQTLPQINEFCFDAAFMRLDYFIHFGYHPWQLLSLLLEYPWIIRIIDALYMLWFVMMAVFGIWMAWTRRRRLRIRYFISVLAVWILLGQGAAVIFSSVGPCYFSKVVETNEDPFQPLMSKLSEIHRHSPLCAVDNQEGVWYALEKGIWLPFGGVSAMPSIHLAFAAILALLTLEIRKWLGVIFVVYLCLIQTGSVILGWHYAIDGYASIILTGFIWYGVRRAVHRLAPESEYYS